MGTATRWQEGILPPWLGWQGGLPVEAAGYAPAARRALRNSADLSGKDPWE